MKWQPPIPSGALYSAPAIALGPGLALLAWCYDQVERDGSLQVSLEKAAADIGKPYGTVRDWWRDMKDGPFFAETVPQGRKGWRATFKRKWIDWRINERNYPDRRDFSDEGENTADIPAVSTEKRDRSDESPNGEVLSEVSSLPDRRDLSGEDLHIGTHDSDQADLLPPPPTQPPRAGGGGRKPSDLERLFGSYGIGTAHDLADLYEREYPDLDLETIRQSCENVFEHGSEHAAYRLLRRLKSSPPEPGKPYPRAGPVGGGGGEARNGTAVYGGKHVRQRTPDSERRPQVEVDLDRGFG